MAKRTTIAREKRVPISARTRTTSARAMRAPRARAEKSVRAVERVVAELAHDIRTPLSGILALSELLGMSPLGERERQWVAALKTSAEHLAALTTLVVDAAKKNAGEFSLLQEPFDLRALTRSAAAALRARAEGARLGCRIEIAADLPVRVIGDGVRLRAAIENLIDNAVKFTARGEVGLRVVAERRARDARILFAVSDSGIGMTPIEVKRLFRPFTQAHAGIARRFGGAGLGLSLVKRLARAMGGDLKVASKPGVGSTFTLSVKVKVADAAGEANNAERSGDGKARGRALDPAA